MHWLVGDLLLTTSGGPKGGVNFVLKKFFAKKRAFLRKKTRFLSDFFDFLHQNYHFPFSFLFSIFLYFLRVCGWVDNTFLRGEVGSFLAGGEINSRLTPYPLCHCMGEWTGVPKAHKSGKIAK